MLQEIKPGERHPDLGPLDHPLEQIPVPVEMPVEGTLPLVTNKLPAKLEEIDLLRYTVLVERAQKLQLLVEKKTEEIRGTYELRQANGQELSALLDGFGAKYGVDFHTNSVQLDGTIVPQQPR